MDQSGKTVLNINTHRVAVEPTWFEAHLFKSTAVCVNDADTGIGAMALVNILQCENVLLAMLSELKSKNCKRENLRVKILSSGTFSESAHEMAVSVVKKFHLTIEAENFELHLERQLQFHSSTAELKFRNLTKMDSVRKNRPLNVLVVDDSSSVRKVLKHLIELDPMLKVMAEASNPVEADLVRSSQEPDVMTLDMEMPGKSGLEYLREFMPTRPLGTIVVTQLTAQESDSVLLSLEAGAFDYMRKPSMKEISGFTKNLHEKLKLAAESKQLLGEQAKNSTSAMGPEAPIEEELVRSSFIVIGASTGGTEAIKEVLLRLPSQFPPVFIVQHMAPTFTASFAKRLAQLCPFPVKEPAHGEVAQPGTVYLAPGGWQMRLTSKVGQLIVELSDEEPKNRFKPSVDCLFESACKLGRYTGVGVLLTGMGADGAQGLLELRNAGFRTIAQDERTSVVFGMPKAAIECGAAERVAPIDKIARLIVDSLNEEKRRLKKAG